MKNSKQIILSKINKKNLFFTDRCNAAIKHAYKMCSKINPNCKKVLVQKEGGWMTYDQFANDMGFDVSYVKTNDSLVDLLDLQEKLMSGEYLFFIFNRVPGYFCKNDSDEINNICHMYNVLTIEDMCAELASSESDFIVGSFGRWKPLNLGHGGFIASNIDLENIECKYPKLSEEVLPFLLGYDERVLKLKEICRHVKKELKEKGFEVVNSKFESLNVIAAFHGNDEKEKIKSYCNEKGYEFEECPRDIRVNRDAISIEIKRMVTKETR